MEIKINFTDFWKNFQPENNYLFNFLSKYYTVTLCDNPDYLFFSVYGDDHLKYNSHNCIKILYTGENLVPDFNHCDYAIGFHFLNFEDRYLRFPLYLIYSGYDSLFTPKSLEKEKVLKRKFCNFVYSNSVNADPFRTLFFEELSKYKKIDSGGRLMNNIGGPVKDKLQFIHDYKFTLAFENSAVNGYTTEKIMEPMTVGSIPIYYGNPLIEKDFNIKSFVHVKSKREIKKIIEYIIQLDQNDEAYIEKWQNPWMGEQHKTLTEWEDSLHFFLEKIFTKPYELALRRSLYGFSQHHTNIERQKAKLYGNRQRLNKSKAKLKSCLSGFKKI